VFIACWGLCGGRFEGGWEHVAVAGARLARRRGHRADRTRQDKNRALGRGHRRTTDHNHTTANPTVSPNSSFTSRASISRLASPCCPAGPKSGGHPSRGPALCFARNPSHGRDRGRDLGLHLKSVHAGRGRGLRSPSVHADRGSYMRRSDGHPSDQQQQAQRWAF